MKYHTIAIAIHSGKAVVAKEIPVMFGEYSAKKLETKLKQCYTVKPKEV